MGANATQAQAIVLFFLAFTMISAGLAQDVSYLWLVLGLVALAGSIVLFLKCKPWEQKEQ